jgi:hypothetical protein
MNDENRNETILAEAVVLRDEPISEALLNLGRAFGKDEEQQRQDSFERLLRDSAFACEGCKRPFEQGEVVHRKRRDIHLDEKGWRYHAYCEACVSKWHPSWLENRHKPVECAGGCGVLVSGWGWGKRLTTCSSRCTENARRARRAVQHEERDCLGCGEPFTPTRADQHYHSNACRQSAYRRRKAGEARA